jgi:hypothetical protein
LDPQNISTFFFWRFIHVQCLVLLVNEYTVYILLCPHTNAQGVVLMFFPHFLSPLFYNIMNIGGHDEGVSRGLHAKPRCFHNFLLVQLYNLATCKTLPNACLNPIYCFFFTACPPMHDGIHQKLCLVLAYHPQSHDPGNGTATHRGTCQYRLVLQQSCTGNPSLWSYM